MVNPPHNTQEALIPMGRDLVGVLALFAMVGVVAVLVSGSPGDLFGLLIMGFIAYAIIS